MSQDPKEIAAEAEKMPWKARTLFPVGEYIGAIKALRQRGYSFAEIAAWLNEKLVDRLQGTKIGRGQVYHAYRFVEAQHHQAIEDAEQRGDVITLPAMSDDEAESKAAELDERFGHAPKKSAKKAPKKK